MKKITRLSVEMENRSLENAENEIFLC